MITPASYEIVFDISRRNLSINPLCKYNQQFKLDPKSVNKIAFVKKDFLSHIAIMKSQYGSERLFTAGPFERSHIKKIVSDINILLVKYKTKKPVKNTASLEYIPTYNTNISRKKTSYSSRRSKWSPLDDDPEDDTGGQLENYWSSSSSDDDDDCDDG